MYFFYSQGSEKVKKKKKKICWRYPESCFTGVQFLSNHPRLHSASPPFDPPVFYKGTEGSWKFDDMLFFLYVCVSVWRSALTETLQSPSCETEITPTGQTKGTQTRSIAKHPSLQPELALPAQLIQSDDLTSTLPTSPTNTHEHCALALQCVDYTQLHSVRLTNT